MSMMLQIAVKEYERTQDDINLVSILGRMDDIMNMCIKPLKDIVDDVISEESNVDYTTRLENIYSAL